ncbi:MAG: hypothetical protein EOQ50_27140 [Mesorhizobium sp.]|nr:MAG: hypothetical protein EOQ50_27140 [Mesorhizobium sp.]RWL82622.1 MAG: hypothetical protein EOR69_13630 [Mesorhizobium sp.]RWL83921.1 MAG: hypothetical protein EOR67_24800 [Mesorhizobium sp.]RWL96162.1 MAG: hypothetical protein EOR70_21030 [Mesorhizobium sp.]TJV71253.1 MAG: hypothetical protein E5X76_16830 [Mesorhizobium sp.]
MSSFAPPSVLPDISPTWGKTSSFAAGAISCNAGDWQKPARHPISPLVGEMSGRSEGGATERGLDRYHQDHPRELG